MNKPRSLRQFTAVLALLVLMLGVWGCADGKKVPKTDLIPLSLNGTSLWAYDASGDLFRSTDLAHTFTRVTPPGWVKPVDQAGMPVSGIAQTAYASESKQQWLVDRGDQLHRTYNGGKSWKNLGKVLPEHSDYLGQMQMTFSDALHGWLQTATGLYRSNDGGVSWELLNETKIEEGYSMIFLSSQKGFRGSSDGLYRTDNGGKDWHAVPLARKGAVMVPQFFDKEAGTLMLIDLEKQERITFVSSDGGESWAEVATPPQQQDEAYSSLTFYNKDNGFLVYVALGTGYSDMETSRLFHTADRGKSWTEVELAELLNSFPLFSSAKDGIALEATLEGKWNMKETADGGKTWTPFTPLVKE